MAEQFLTLMADLDDASQQMMNEWYIQLREAGFTGTQTADLPYHISLGTFALEQEQAVVEEMVRLGKEFAPIPIHISHIGVFAGGKVLFGAPEMSHCDLVTLHDAVKIKSIDTYSWTPHATLLIDEPEITFKALPVLLQSFRPFVGKIVRLHLCAFWPTREITSIKLSNA